ncbi:MAG: glycosyltransferase family 2 protein [Eubacteriales bacterium]|jgi:glycosyltransferase involved in cell wall biosynthesis
MEIRISVIVPVYKVEYKNLKNMINSLKSQDYDKSEFIIVDDGSPDDCGKICDTLCSDDQRFHIIHTKNFGVSHARNTGLSVAKGKYIVFVDGDDRLPDGCLKLYDEWIENNKSFDLLIGNYQINNKEITTTGKVKEFKDSKKLLEIQASFLSGKGVDHCNYNGAPWGKLYSSEIISQNSLKFDENLPRSQDNEFNFRYMHYVKDCIYLDENVYVYTINNTSAMRKYWPNAVENAEKFLDKIVIDIKSEKNPALFYEAYYKVGFSKLFDIMNTYLFHKENKNSTAVKIHELKELCESKRYQTVIHNVKVDSSSYRKMLVSLLRIHAYYAVYALVVFRKKAQRQM